MEQDPNKPRTRNRNPLNAGDVLQDLNSLGLNNVQVSIPQPNIKVPPAREVANNLLESWVRLLLNPRISNFDQMAYSTTWTTAIASVLATGLVMGVINAIRGIFGNVLFGTFNAPIALIMTPVMTLVGFFAISGALYYGAKRLGGVGQFGPQTKMLGLLMPPFGLALLILGFKWIGFTLLGGLLGGYVVFLTWLMLRSAHRLDAKNAGILIILPALLVLLGILF